MFGSLLFALRGFVEGDFHLPARSLKEGVSAAQRAGEAWAWELLCTELVEHSEREAWLRRAQQSCWWSYFCFDRRLGMHCTPELWNDHKFTLCSVCAAACVEVVKQASGT